MIAASYPHLLLHIDHYTHLQQRFSPCLPATSNSSIGLRVIGYCDFKIAFLNLPYDILTMFGYFQANRQPDHLFCDKYVLHAFLTAVPRWEELHRMSAVWLYDYIDTLPTEILVIWSNRLTITSSVFLINRYGFLIYLVFSLAASVGGTMTDTLWGLLFMHPWRAIINGDCWTVILAVVI